MTRELRAIAAVVAWATIASVTPSARQDSQTTFRARADSVAVDVSVRQRGRPVTGLTAQDFELLDNGAPQQIADISYERLPIDLTVALDISGSVTGDVLAQLRRSVVQLTGDLVAADRLRLIAFNTRITRIADFAAPGANVDSAFDRMQPAGGSAILDAIAVALTAPTAPDRRHLVVLFSDGEDSTSILDHNMLLDIARRTTPTLDVVLASTRLRAVLGVASPAAVARSEMWTQLAQETGGIAESVSGTDNLSAAFRRMLSDFRTSYVLHFTPQVATRSGVHTLDVRVKRTGVDVRARKSYGWR